MRIKIQNRVDVAVSVQDCFEREVSQLMNLFSATFDSNWMMYLDILSSRTWSANERSTHMAQIAVGISWTTSTYFCGIACVINHAQMAPDDNIAFLSIVLDSVMASAASFFSASYSWSENW